MCDSLLLAEDHKCAAPKASQTISVGNSLALQIQKENNSINEAATCLIRETSSNSANNTSGNRKEEKVNFFLILNHTQFIDWIKIRLGF